MGLITVLTRDAAILSHFSSTDRASTVAVTRSWDRVLWLIRERPVTDVILDSAELPAGRDVAVTLAEVRRRFPSVGTVFVAKKLRPLTFLQLGRAGITDLTLLPYDDLGPGLERGMAASLRRSTTSRVIRAIGMGLHAADRRIVQAALDGALLGWQADDLATYAGWTRAHLSVRLRSRGLPSAGHLLLWAKLLHAGRWLSEPGRSAESVSRQLEYSSGAAFRRALRNYLGTTPTELVDGGGFSSVLRRFLDVCGLRGRLGDGRSVA
jgi:AraC-like DNA-binding protein